MECTKESERSITEAALTEAFRKMDVEAHKVQGFFGQGHSMHSAARKVAPRWLQQWDDDRRWIIQFSQGFDGFICLAKAFGYSKDEVLDLLTAYRLRFDGSITQEE